MVPFFIGTFYQYLNEFRFSDISQVSLPLFLNSKVSQSQTDEKIKFIRPRKIITKSNVISNKRNLLISTEQTIIDPNNLNEEHEWAIFS